MQSIICFLIKPSVSDLNISGNTHTDEIPVTTTTTTTPPTTKPPPPPPAR